MKFSYFRQLSGDQPKPNIKAIRIYGNGKMWILHAFSQIDFIFQGSPENHSKTLNNLRNIFPLLNLKNQLSGITHIHF